MHFGHEVYGTVSEPCENATVPLRQRDTAVTHLQDSKSADAENWPPRKQKIVFSHHYDDKAAVRKT